MNLLADLDKLLSGRRTTGYVALANKLASQGPFPTPTWEERDEEEVRLASLYEALPTLKIGIHPVPTAPEIGVVKKAFRCGLCGAEGHYRRTCGRA